MNEERLYFNGLELDLIPESPVALTLQVNDIVTLNDRQTNFTREIKLPKSPKNVKIMDFLGVAGNSSNVPYQRNVVNYFIGNDCLIRDGWGILNETSDYYKLSIYDGSIDLYKSIENKNLSDLNLSELTHEKNLDTITESWTGNTKYKYILADFNGKSMYQNGTQNVINTDYLVPSVSCKYIWNKIFSENNATYEGSFSQTQEFQNLWMAYPKGVSISTVLTPIATFYGGATNAGRGGGARYLIDSTGITSRAAEILSITSLTNNGYGITDEFVRAKENRVFNIKITGKIEAKRTSGGDALPVELWLVKNSQLHTANSVANIQNVPVTILATDISNTTEINIDQDIILEVGETINILEKASGGVSISHLLTSQTNFNITLTYYDSVVVDFEQELSDFPVKNFLNEIIWRFGLTAYKDKYSNHFKFMNVSEVLDNRSIIDWSKKFQDVDSEKYIYSNYGQNNLLRYKYNDDQNTHNNGSLKIENVNIDAEKNIIESNIYSPEKEKVEFTNVTESNVYKLWDKNPKENGTIEYKSLDKRYYFLRARNHTFTNQRIGSEQLPNNTRVVTVAPVESFSSLSFEKVIENHYQSFSNILKKSKLYVAKFFLTPIDIAEFDFTKLYFIEQLGGQFLINKISNYVKGKITKVEMIKVNFQTTVDPTQPVDNRKIILEQPFVITANNRLVRFTFQCENFISNNFAIQVKSQYQTDFINVNYTTSSPTVAQLPGRTIYPTRVKCLDTGIISNEYTTSLL